MKNLAEFWDVLNYGKTEFQGDTLYWVDVEEFDPYMRTKYISIDHRNSGIMLGVTLTTSDEIEATKRICELEGILKTIQIKN